MTDALRAFIDGKVIYALTNTRYGATDSQSAPGYQQDPQTFAVEQVTVTGRMLKQVRREGIECELWETPAWCSPQIEDR